MSPSPVTVRDFDQVDGINEEAQKYSDVVTAVFGTHPYQPSPHAKVASSKQETQDDLVDILEQSGGSLLALNDYMNQMGFDDDYEDQPGSTASTLMVDEIDLWEFNQECLIHRNRQQQEATTIGPSNCAQTSSLAAHKGYLLASQCMVDWDNAMSCK